MRRGGSPAHAAATPEFVGLPAPTRGDRKCHVLAQAM